MNNKKEKSLLSRFFSHNITLLVMAFLIAVSAWFIINLSSNSENRTASVDVPIIVELPEDAQKEELKLFGADGLSATVVVKGNLMATSTVTSTDIQAVATQNASLLSPGYHNLPIVAKQTGIKSNYTIDSVTPSNITVYVDREKQAEFTIDNQITVEHDDEKNNYANAALSQSKVIVTGPETEVNEIKTVAVIDTLTEDVTSKEEKLTFLDEDGNDLYLEYCSCDVDSIEVSVTVLPIKTVSLSVDTSNAPSDNPKIEISGMAGGKWIRFTAECYEDERREAKEEMLEKSPGLKSMYSVDDGIFCVLYFKNVKADICSFTEPVKTIEF